MIVTRTILSCLLIGLGGASQALAWGSVAHAVIGQLAEQYLLEGDPGLHTFLTRLRAPAHRSQVQEALLDMALPEPGEALRVLANWADWYKRQPGMLAHDGRRHFVNLPHRARYQRARHCPDGVCSIETLLQQRAILADPHAPLGQRAVALAWVTHLVGDLHQPLHAGKAEDRGGNLTCVVWQGQPSRLVSRRGKLRCSGANLHAVWDSKMIKAVTGFRHSKEARTYAHKLQPLLKPVQAAERPLLAYTHDEWRAVVEGWHSETQALILSHHIYPRGNTIGHAYIQTHYRTIRQLLLRAAVRLAAMLHRTLNP